MNADAMTMEVAPRRLARITGAFYLATMLAGIFAQGYVSNRLVVMHDASATAANILAHPTMFQLGFTIYMLEMACNIVMIVLLCRLLRPAGTVISMLATLLGVAGCVIKTFSRVFFILPLFLLESASHANVPVMAQAKGEAILLLRINDQGAGMALIFAGFFALLTGWLIYRSTFLPRVLGVISMLAGIGWLTFLIPTLGYQLFNYLAGFGFLGALVLIAWLLVVGVNEDRWWEQARLVLH